MLDDYLRRSVRRLVDRCLAGLVGGASLLLLAWLLNAAGCVRPPG